MDMLIYLGFFCPSLLLVGCLNIIVWIHAVLGVLYQGFRTRVVYLNYVTCLRYAILVQNPQYACVLYFCICTCSVQLSMFHMEGRSGNTIIIISIIIEDLFRQFCVLLHRYGSGGSNLLSHLVTVCWDRVNWSKCWYHSMPNIWWDCHWNALVFFLFFLFFS